MTACATADQTPRPAQHGSDPQPAMRPVAETTATAMTTSPAKTPTPPPQSGHPTSASVALQGQLSIKLLAMGEQAAKGVSMGFFFEGQPEAGRLELMTPMGSQIAQVGWSTKGAWLRGSGSGAAPTPPEPMLGPEHATGAVDDGVARFESIEALSAHVLGEAIPLQTLIHWMQGHPDPARPSVGHKDAASPAGQFTQDGWLIDTREWPRRLQATRPANGGLRGIQIRVHLDR